ncbi:MAG TPA: hypothetical protein VEA69_15855 [Tepidisphaeraceae bacterium]|nr:hypothetical protein [Tepidisphaeraceae bacterium]
MAKKNEQPKADDATAGSTLVEIPMAEAVGYCQTTLDASLSGAEAVTLSRVVAGLRAAGKTFLDGRKVETGTDAVKWILEQAAQ